MDSFAYLVLGAPHSGRRAAVFDLVKDLASESNPFEVVISEMELPTQHDEKVQSLPGVELKYFETDLGSLSRKELNPEATSVIITAGAMNPVDQVEGLKDLLGQAKKELGRIITVVNCHMLSRHHSLFAYYDACIHFSDVALLNKRESISEKFAKDFIKRYKDERYPCLFERVKQGRIKNPDLVLETEPRRISLHFDAEEDAWLDEDLETVEADPYLDRLPSGIRRKTIPDIASILKDKRKFNS